MRLLTLIFTLLLTLSGAYAYVGKISAMKGDVRIQRGAEEIKAFIGSDIEESDTIMTNASSRAQLYFKDDTVVSIGKNSTFKVEGFFFDGDPQNSANNATFSTVKGAFKVMTGQIGKVAPKSFKLSTRTATIGIRGTQFLGNIKSDADQIACTDGKISVATLDGKSEVIVKAGQITFVPPGEMPTPPREFTVDELKSLSKAATNGDKGSSAKSTGKKGDASASKEEEGDEGKEEVVVASPEVEVPVPIDGDKLNEYDYRFPIYHTQLGPDGFDGSYLTDMILYEWESEFYGMGIDISLKSSNFTSVADNNEYTEWGRWDINYDMAIEGYLIAIEEHLYVLQGSVAETPSTVIDSFYTNGTMLTYTGSMLGQAFVFESDANEVGVFRSIGDINPSNSSITITMDFGANEVYSGTLQFDTAQGVQTYTLDSATASSWASGYGFGYSDSNAEYTEAVYIDGYFYGPGAEAIGGEFDIYSETGVNAVGVFEGQVSAQ